MGLIEESKRITQLIGEGVQNSDTRLIELFIHLTNNTFNGDITQSADYFGGLKPLKKLLLTKEDLPIHLKLEIIKLIVNFLGDLGISATLQNSVIVKRKKSDEHPGPELEHEGQIVWYLNSSEHTNVLETPLKDLTDDSIDRLYTELVKSEISRS